MKFNTNLTEAEIYEIVKIVERWASYHDNLTPLSTVTPKENNLLTKAFGEQWNKVIFC